MFSSQLHIRAEIIHTTLTSLTDNMGDGSKKFQKQLWKWAISSSMGFSVCRSTKISTPTVWPQFSFSLFNGNRRQIVRKDMQQRASGRVWTHASEHWGTSIEWGCCFHPRTPNIWYGSMLEGVCLYSWQLTKMWWGNGTVLFHKGA